MLTQCVRRKSPFLSPLTSPALFLASSCRRVVWSVVPIYHRSYGGHKEIDWQVASKPTAAEAAGHEYCTSPDACALVRIEASLSTLPLVNNDGGDDLREDFDRLNQYHSKSNGGQTVSMSLKYNACSEHNLFFTHIKKQIFPRERVTTLLLRPPETSLYNIPSGQETLITTCCDQNESSARKQVSSPRQPQCTREDLPIRRTKAKGRSMWEQVKQFPSGLQQLFRDYLTYRNITAALETHSNSWKGTLPRRQLEHQRRLRWDCRIVVPIAAAYTIPIVGNIFPLIAVYFPRQMLSRQFHDPVQVREFAKLDFEYHMAFFESLSAFFCWSGESMDRLVATDAVSSHPEEDAGGPVVFNMDELMHLLRTARFVKAGEVDKRLTCFESLSRAHLTTLFLAAGFLKIPPLVANAVVTYLVPSFVLRRILGLIALEIVVDDKALIREGNIKKRCRNLTDDEVVAACTLRCLPTGTEVEIEEMRVCLTNHLRMVERAMRSIEEDPCLMCKAKCNDSLKLTVLHLPAFRHRLKGFVS